MKYILLFFVILLLSVNVVLAIYCKKVKRKNDMYMLKDEKKENILQLESVWINLLHRKESIFGYLRKRGIETVAIYGIGVLGKNLFDELNGSEIQVQYIIDAKKKNKEYKGVRICDMRDEVLEVVDAIIVTPIQEFSAIRDNLEKVYNGRIVSIEEIVYYALWNV